MEKARRLWKIGGIALALVTAIASVWWLEFERRRTHRARVLAEAAALGERVPRGVQPHGPLLGEAVPGEAITHYDAAMQEIDVERAKGNDLSMALASDKKPADPAKALAPYRKALSAFATGAAASTINLDQARSLLTELKPERTPLQQRFPLVQPLVGIAMFDLEHQLATDAADAAVRGTAALLTLSVDLTRGATMLHELCAGGVLWSACSTWTDECLRATPAENLRSLRDALVAFDRALPSFTRSLEGEVAVFAHLIDVPAIGPDDVEAALRTVESLADTEDALWSVRSAALNRVTAAHPGRILSNCPLVEQKRRAGVAQARLLHLAVLHHLGEPLPSLRDPLGDGDLAIEALDGTTIVVRSTGLDEGRRIERIAARR